MYRRAVEEDERDIQVYYSLDDLYEKTGDVHTRHDLLRRGLELFPDDDEMAIRMARCFNRRKWSGKAAEVLENHSFHRRHQSWHLMQMAREAIEETYGLLAIEAIRDGDRERALANIEKASRAQEKTREWFD
jgi:tetratricopeptide (TPR) repeat protein